MGPLPQGIETRRLIARGVAQQWFGGLMRPATAADGWLLEGLAGWAEDHFLRTFMGANELAYRFSLVPLIAEPSDRASMPPSTCAPCNDVLTCKTVSY